MRSDTPEIILSTEPDRMIMTVEGLTPKDARRCANNAVTEARRRMPKSSGNSASRVTPMYGNGYFGIRWQDSYVWFQENGIKAFTMRSLAGKLIPMWIDDPTGAERLKNPKAKTRVTVSGKSQVLIFRKAANFGARKTVYRRSKVTGQMVRTDVPQSYPGAPGRIGVRQAGAPMTTPGKTGGQIAGGNSGVRWRHPGLQPRFFLNSGMTVAALKNGIQPVRLYVADARWKPLVAQSQEKAS